MAVLGVWIGGAGAVLGAIFVPYPNDVTSEGELPGDSGLHYALNTDEGTLRLTSRNEDGSADLIAVAKQGADGIFYEAATGFPIGRIVGGSLVLDAASLPNAAEEQTEDRPDSGAESETKAKEDEPKLCPEPGPDAPHGAKEPAMAY